MEIVVSKEYTELPGGRYESQGQFSGERFRDTILYPKYIECLKKKEKLIVNLDGGYGYGSGFLEEAFGGLVRRLKREKREYKKVLMTIEIVSEDQYSLIERIHKYIKDEIKR